MLRRRARLATIENSVRILIGAPVLVPLVPGVVAPTVSVSERTPASDSVSYVFLAGTSGGTSSSTGTLTVTPAMRKDAAGNLGMVVGLASFGGYLGDKVAPGTPLWVIGLGVGAAYGIKLANDLGSS